MMSKTNRKQIFIFKRKIQIIIIIISEGSFTLPRNIAEINVSKRGEIG